MLATLVAASAASIALASMQQIAVGENVQVSLPNSGATHYEVLASADPQRPERMVVGAIFYPDGGGEASTIVYSTLDGGRSWLETLGGESLIMTGDPALAHGPEGEVYYTASSLRPGRDREMLLFRSPDGVRWERMPSFTYTDRQYITVDGTGGEYHGRIYVNGNNRTPRTISDFVVFHSSDGGRSFQGPAKRAGFGTFIARNMGNAVVASDGTLIGLFSQLEGSGQALNVIRSTDGGESLRDAVRIDEMVVAGGRKEGRNNVNALPALAIDASSRYRDRLYAVWPDRRSGHSEIWGSVSGDVGRTWSKPRRISDTEATTTDHFMPNVVVNKDGVVGVMWYDRRDHADNLGWTVRFSASLDGGETWLPSSKLSEVGQHFGSHTRWSSLRPATARASRSEQGSANDPQRVRLQLNSFFYIGGDTAGLVAAADGTFHAFWVDDHTGVPQVWTTAVMVGAVALPVSSAVPELEISAHASLELTQPTFERSSNELRVTARVVNTSNDELHGPFAVRVVELASQFGDLQIVNSDNQQPGRGARWIFSDDSLLPGHGSQARRLRLRLRPAASPPPRSGQRFPLDVLDMAVEVYGRKPSRGRSTLTPDQVFTK